MQYHSVDLYQDVHVKLLWPFILRVSGRGRFIGTYLLLLHVQIFIRK